MIECSRCGFKIPKAELTTIQPLECPTCGKSLAQRRQVIKSGLGLIQGYFFDVRQIITQPQVFFRHMPLQGGLSRPLAFALVTHWLGTALSSLWNLVLGGSLGDHFRRILKSSQQFDYDSSQNENWIEAKDRIAEWFFGVGPVVGDPFLTLAKILFTSWLVYMGARILISPGKDNHPKEITFESSVRIICFGMTPAIFSVIPWVGGLASSIGILIITVIGVKEAYRVDLGRALVVALFPKLLFVGIIMMALLFFLGMMIKVIAFAV